MEFFESAFPEGAELDSQPAARIDTTHVVTNPRIRLNGDRACFTAPVEAQNLPKDYHLRHALLENLCAVTAVRDADLWRMQRVYIECATGDPPSSPVDKPGAGSVAVRTRQSAQQVEVLLRVKGMDDDAAEFETFARAQLGGLLRTSLAVCGDPALGEDLVQEVLIKAMRNWKRISKLDNPPAYLRRMLVNEFISDRRKNRSSPRAEIEPAEVVLDHAERIAEQDSLRDVIRQLPRQQQAALALRFYVGLSDPEIADHLGCRPGTVRGYLSRALATLRMDPNYQSVERHTSNLPTNGGVRS